MLAAMAPQSVIDPPRCDVARWARRRENAERLHVVWRAAWKQAPARGRCPDRWRVAARRLIGGLITTQALRASATHPTANVAEFTGVSGLQRQHGTATA